jgi:hypothetical protein
MDAVGNGVDGMACEHEARDFAVFLSNAVDKVAEVQGQNGHIERIVATEYVFHRHQLISAQNTHHHFHREAVMARGRLECA